MADQASKNATAKERIINHMNGDHADSLSYYLRHYAKLSERAARGATITDLSLSSMDFQTADGRTHIIPINPPMKTWADARTRTVDMDRESRAALGISHLRITEYLPPRSPLHISVFSICLCTYVILATKHKMVKGTWVYDTVLPFFPGGPESFLWLANKVALPMVALHLGEAFWLDRSRLRKYGVAMGTGLWFKWIGSCFIEGFGCFQRFDGAVKRKEVEAEKAQH